MCLRCCEMNVFNFSDSMWNDDGHVRNWIYDYMCSFTHHVVVCISAGLRCLQLDNLSQWALGWKNTTVNQRWCDTQASLKRDDICVLCLQDAAANLATENSWSRNRGTLIWLYICIAMLEFTFDLEWRIRLWRTTIYTSCHYLIALILFIRRFLNKTSHHLYPR